MVVVLTVATEAGMWDGLGHCLLLPRPTLILQAVLSQADSVPPGMMEISLGCSPFITVPSDPGVQAPSFLFSQTSLLEAWDPALSFPKQNPALIFHQAQPTSSPGIHSRFFTMGCCEDPVVLDEDTPAEQLVPLE